MKILHTIADLGVNGGGPTTCTYNLIQGLIENGVEVTLQTLTPDHHDTLIANDSFIKTINRISRPVKLA